MGHKIHKAFSCKIVVLVFLQMQNTSGASALLLQAMNWLMQDVIINYVFWPWPVCPVLFCGGKFKQYP